MGGLGAACRRSLECALEQPVSCDDCPFVCTASDLSSCAPGNNFEYVQFAFQSEKSGFGNNRNSQRCRCRVLDVQTNAHGKLTRLQRRTHSACCRKFH